jgi:hypothetical protein
MESKDAYKAKIDAQLKEWSIKIADLKGKAELVESNVKVEYLKQVDAMRAKKEETQAKLEELKKAGDDAWETLKAGVEKAASELKDSINSAISKLNK